MKIRFCCSFFGCLRGHLHGFTGNLSGRPAHHVVSPVDVGLGQEGSDWTVAFFNDCTSEMLSRLVRRSVECSGGSETVDFFVSLADPSEVGAAELRQMVDSVNSAFAHLGPVEWSFVLPEGLWMDRLRAYHGVKEGRAVAVSNPQADLPDALANAMEGMGLACQRVEPAGVLKFLSAHLHGFTPPPYPHSVEGFTAHDSQDSLLVTADPRVFAAWRDVMYSPAGELLPEGWEAYMARYGYLLARVLPHFSTGAVVTDQAFPENA